MKSFRRLTRFLGPRRFTGGSDADQEIAKVWYSLDLIKDAFLDRLRLGLLARHPAHTTSDALPLMGRDRGIVRGLNEPKAAYAARLSRFLDDWRSAGNALAMMRQLKAYLQAPVRIRIATRRGNWYTLHPDDSWEYLLDQGNFDWDGAPASPRWARAWVIIYPLATGIIEPGPTIGDAELWGGALGTEGYTIGSTATPSMVRSIKSIAKTWKPAGQRVEHIIVAFDEDSFDPTDAVSNPDGTWEFPGYPVGDDLVEARISTARYWPVAYP